MYEIIYFQKRITCVIEVSFSQSDFEEVRANLWFRRLAVSGYMRNHSGLINSQMFASVIWYVND